MTACVAVTRGGWGMVWRFGSARAADRHPLIQYGDAIVSSPAEVSAAWFGHRASRMAERVLGDRRLARDIAARLAEVAEPERTRVLVRIGEELWRRLREVAAEPPSDPAEICAQVVRDRDLYDRAQAGATGDDTMAKADTAAAAAPAPKAPKEKKIGGHLLTAKIEFGADKDGIAYGPKNNPKRAGSKANASFALYKAGMTLQKALDAGIPAGDLSWDLKHGFIKIAA